MSSALLNAGKLFQTLLTADKPTGSTVAADLDVESFDSVPFITHSAVVAQGGNGYGLWSVTLTVNLFLEPAGAHDVASAVYAVIHSWGDDPTKGVVAGVGAVEELEDLNAFIPVSGEVVMVNKAVRHYQGSFNATVRAH